MNKFQKLMRALAVTSALVLTLGFGAAYANVRVAGENELTGPWSENENEWDIENDLDVEIDNEADFDNDFDVDVNSGENEIEKNTEVGDIRTGDISGTIEIENEANSDSLKIGVADFGDIYVAFENELTGPNSENENEANIENKTDIDIDNEAKIDNDIDLDVNTGENEIEKNTVVGDIRTGDIRINASFENEVNQNGVMDLSKISAPDVRVSAVNDTTGPNSENENEVNIENRTDIDIDNEANIDNDIDIDANTGENEIENNTCVGDITTGDIKLTVSTSNIAN